MRAEEISGSAIAQRSLRKIWHRAGLWCAAGLIAWIFVIFRYRYSVMGPGPDQLMNWSAPAPFQYRLLVPSLLHAFCWATGTLQRDHTIFYQTIDFGCVTATLVVLAHLLRRIGASPAWILVLVVMLFANYVYGAPRIRIIMDGQTSLLRANFITPYDMPALLFTTLGLLLIHARRWSSYYLLLVTAVLNRETAVLLILVFAATQFDRMPRRGWLTYLAGQMAILITLKLALAWIFAGNGGEFAGLIENDPSGERRVRLLTNLYLLHNPAGVPAFGGMWVPFLLASLRVKDRFVRRAALATIPPFLLTMASVGNMFEFRVFTEILPLMTLVIASGLPAFLPARQPLASTDPST